MSMKINRDHLEVMAKDLSDAYEDLFMKQCKLSIECIAGQCHRVVQSCGSLYGRANQDTFYGFIPGALICSSFSAVFKDQAWRVELFFLISGHAASGLYEFKDFSVLDQFNGIWFGSYGDES